MPPAPPFLTLVPSTGSSYGVYAANYSSVKMYAFFVRLLINMSGLILCITSLPQNYLHFSLSSSVKYIINVVSYKHKLPAVNWNVSHNVLSEFMLCFTFLLPVCPSVCLSFFLSFFPSAFLSFFLSSYCQYCCT